MLLIEKETGNLVEVMDVTALLNPVETDIVTRSQMGEEEQDPETAPKNAFSFPSGESLPRCWLDPNYRNA